MNSHMLRCGKDAVEAAPVPVAGPVGILGGGAMGCLFGAYLAEAGHDVVLVDIDTAVVERITEQGVVLERAGRTRQVRGLRASSGYAVLRDASLILVFVKASATRAAAEALAPHLAEGALALTLQNGLGNAEVLAERLPRGSVAAGTTGCGAAVLGPGHIRLAGIAETVIGELDGKGGDRLARVAALLSAAGLPARVAEDVAGLVWTKLMANVGINAITALTGLQNGRIATEPEAWALASQAVLEAAAVAAASGVRLETDDPVSYVRRVAEATAENYSSMLQDIRAGRKTEIAVINGEIARRAEALGLPAPVNAHLASLVRLREKADVPI